jgi:tRNA nucleotidyltransferase (CCA-adding enzyme)
MPDYIFMLESRLSPEQLQALTRVQLEAQDLGLNIYLVGGAVRDLMTGSPIRDLDFTVEGNPLRLVRRLQDKKTRVDIDKAWRSAELMLADGVSLSLGMACSETFEEPGRPSRMSPAPILEDLRRRDFSVNAMGISLTPGSRGLLLDPTNGLADIENRELRVLHNYSFVHDPVRLLRLVRFATRLGFRPEPRTQELFESALQRGYQEYIPAATLGKEVSRVAREESVVAVLKSLGERELLTVLHPMLQKRRPDYERLAKFQRYRQQAEEEGYQVDSFVPVMHYLARRLKGRSESQLFRNLGLKKVAVKQVRALTKEVSRLVKALSRRRTLSPRDVYNLLCSVSAELLVFTLAEYSGKKKVQSKIYNYLFKYRPLRKKLPVRELQLMGVPLGPKSDQILERYFEAQLDGKLRGRVEQLRFLRKLAGVPKPTSKAESRKEKTKKPEAPAPREGRETATEAGGPALAREKTMADETVEPQRQEKASKITQERTVRSRSRPGRKPKTKSKLKRPTKRRRR